MGHDSSTVVRVVQKGTSGDWVRVYSRDGQVDLTVKKVSLPRYVRTALNQYGSGFFTFFPGQGAYGDHLDVREFP